MHGKFFDDEGWALSKLDGFAKENHADTARRDAPLEMIQLAFKLVAQQRAKRKEGHMLPPDLIINCKPMGTSPEAAGHHGWHPHQLKCILARTK